MTIFKELHEDMGHLVPQESTGFSPYELFYGRAVRGPLFILKELWTKELEEPEIKNSYQYVFELREKLEDTLKLAHTELQKAQNKGKHYYGRKAKVRKFVPGDKVLVLLPTDHKKLLMQWKGPFEVSAVMGLNDYKVSVKGKERVYHANLLKKYFEREDPVHVRAATVEMETISRENEHVKGETEEVDPVDDVDFLEIGGYVAKESVNDVAIGEHLSHSKRVWLLTRVCEEMEKYAYKLASEIAQRNAQRGKRQSDKKVRSIVLEPDDKKGAGSPVYEVRLEAGTKKGVLHRNLLLPFTYLPVEEADVRPKTKLHSRQRQRRPPLQNNKPLIQTSRSAGQDDEDDDIPSFPPNQLQAQYPNNTVKHPRTEEQDIQESVAISGTADTSEDVKPDPPVDDLQNDFTPSTRMEPEQSPSSTTQPIVENRQPRIRRPPIRMTYDVPGHPTFYPGVTTNMNMVSNTANLPPPWLSTSPQMFADDTKVYRELSNITRDSEARKLGVDQPLS
ncbi:hypothetical protein AWC38_SpisGene22484 [Stylophora pistillata]|uniref:Retrovirus-related Pol polyprotein n=1 Tax=Stylophora pistillata TaxID=50429 RepID=A0A2B4RAM8_STYPI|nr:hypothetical protein AWC38_SpisGene22484 [Stylophora pistillata]